jgi:hypothetical protein
MPEFSSEMAGVVTGETIPRAIPGAIVETAPIICSKALENSAIVSGVTVAIVSPTAAPATSSTAVGAT